MTPIRDEFAGGREIEREPECPALTQAQIAEVTETVYVPSDPKVSDVLFVFGTSRMSGWPQVAELYRRGMASTVLITGGVNKDGVTLSHVIRDCLIAHGVPKEAIVTDERSTNTFEDALFGKKILEEGDIWHRHIVFACNSTHGGRCMRTLRKVFPDSSISAFVYDWVADDGTTTITASNWWQSDIGRRRTWGEYLRIKLYSSRGDIC